MLTTIRDNEGNIITACEWWCVDVNGIWNPRGKYIWVNQLEHSPKGGVREIKDIIAEIAWTCPWAVGAYWERRDKGNKLRAFTRKRLLKVTEEVGI